MTPSHPPRPPIEALPKRASMETSSSANKHPLEQPAQQGPPNEACSAQGVSIWTVASIADIYGSTLSS